MLLNEYLKKTNRSVYSLSKSSNVPYTTVLSICRGKANIDECRVGTLRALSNALGVSLLDLINGDLKPNIRTFIDDSIELDVASLPLPLQKTIKELEEYDASGDSAFYACADTMLLMADTHLASGEIDSATYEKLARRYPIG